MKIVQELTISSFLSQVSLRSVSGHSQNLLRSLCYLDWRSLKYFVLFITNTVPLSVTYLMYNVLLFQARSTPILSVSGPQLVTHMVRSLHQVRLNVNMVLWETEKNILVIWILCKLFLYYRFRVRPRLPSPRGCIWPLWAQSGDNNNFISMLITLMIELNN